MTQEDIRSYPVSGITAQFRFTALERALLAARVSILDTGDVRAFQAQRLAEEKAKAAPHVPQRLAAAAVGAAGIVVGLMGFAAVFKSVLLAIHESFLLAVLLMTFAAVAAGVCAEGTGLARRLRRGADLRKMLAWRTYPVAECAEGRYLYRSPQFRGLGLATATVIPPELQARIELIAATGVSAFFAMEQLDIDPFLWVGCKEEKFYIGQFGEKGFVR